MKREEPTMTTITERHSLTSVVTLAASHRIWRLLVGWADRRKQRLDLDELDDRLLADIGWLARPPGSKPRSRSGDADCRNSRSQIRLHISIRSNC
jgi:uncharacterized protein YjiS (DUF1127 family)